MKSAIWAVVMAWKPLSWRVFIRWRKLNSVIWLGSVVAPLVMAWNMITMTTVPGALFWEDQRSRRYWQVLGMYVWGVP